jgi:hypothetical protein
MVPGGLADFQSTINQGSLNHCPPLLAAGGANLPSVRAYLGQRQGIRVLVPLLLRSGQERPTRPPLQSTTPQHPPSHPEPDATIQRLAPESGAGRRLRRRALGLESLLEEAVGSDRRGEPLYELSGV